MLKLGIKPIKYDLIKKIKEKESDHGNCPGEYTYKMLIRYVKITSVIVTISVNIDVAIFRLH